MANCGLDVEDAGTKLVPSAVLLLSLNNNQIASGDEGANTAFNELARLYFPELIMLDDWASAFT